jgi:hypothetical protein
MLNNISEFKINYLGMYCDRTLEDKHFLEVQKLSATERVKALALEVFAVLALALSFGDQDWKNVTKELFAQVWTGVVYKPISMPPIDDSAISRSSDSSLKIASVIPSSDSKASDSSPEVTEVLTDQVDRVDYSHFLTPISEEAFSQLPMNIQMFRREIEGILDQGQRVLDEKFPRWLAELVLKWYLPYSKWDRKYPMSTEIDTMGRNYIFDKIKEQLSPEAQQLLFPRYEKVQDRLILHQDALTQNEMTFLQSCRPLAHSYQDDEIIEVIARPGESRADGKKPIFQSGQRGCTGATGAMIASDILGTDQPALTCNLGNDSNVTRYLRRCGLEPIKSSVSSLDELQAKIEEHGCSAHVTVTSCGGHVVVVDCVKDDRVEIRDPYHGWAAAIKKDAFLAYWEGDSHNIIQARKIS